MTRLTAEREAQIRDWASIVASNWGRENYDDLLAELDAVRAERDDTQRKCSEAFDSEVRTEHLRQRAEATLAAIRTWIAESTNRIGNHGAISHDQLLALLDATPKETP